METRPVVPDRKLLARLVLIREEARNMMGGGILDERNDRGFNTLPESEVWQISGFSIYPPPPGMFYGNFVEFCTYILNLMVFPLLWACPAYVCKYCTHCGAGEFFDQAGGLKTWEDSPGDD